MFSLLDGTSTTSTEPARALAHLAALASPPVHALLKLGVPAEEVLAADEQFAAAFAAYLRDYGCRTLSRTSLANRRWRSGRICLALVRDQLDSRVDAETQQELAASGTSPPTRPARCLEALTWCASSGLWSERSWRTRCVRTTRSIPERAARLLRRAALELGRRLASRDQIIAVEDIFFLHPDEARALLADGTVAAMS